MIVIPTQTCRATAVGLQQVLGDQAEGNGVMKDSSDCREKK